MPNFEEALQRRSESTIQLATANDLLIKAQWPHLAINEQRLVLYMLSLIKRSDEDFQTYRISIRELANILGLKRKDLYYEFDKAAEGLMQKVINWTDPDYKKGKKFVKVAWCSYAARIPGDGYVEMRFDPALKPFLLALKGNFTIWGDRRSVIRLKSHYALRIYQFIKYNQGLSSVDGRKSAVVDLDWFKEYLAIPTGSYSLFGNFKMKVLKPAQKDIREKTDVEFNFKQIKKGRKVDRLEFFWKKNKRHDQMELPGMSDQAPVKLEDILKLEFGITPEKKVAKLIQDYSRNHIDHALVVAREYIERLQSQGRKVGSIAAIAIKAIEEGWRKQKSTIEIDQEKKLKSLVAAKEAALLKKEDDANREEQKKQEAQARYEALGDAEKEDILKEFREYLVALGNRTVVDRYDKEGMTPGVVEALLKAFVFERFGGKK